MDSPSRRRSRPVADLPIADLRDGVDVAKRWLLELIASAPLASAKSVPAAELARGGPPLCAAMVDAIESDEALETLSRSAPAADAGHLAGAPDAAATAAAVEALRAALQSAVRARLSEPSAELVASVSDRVSDISATVLARSLGAGAADLETADPQISSVAGAQAEETVPHLRPVVPEPDEPIMVSKPADGDPWIVAMERRIDRSDGDEPFAVLTTEIDDVDRLVVSGSGKEVAGAIDAAERALIAGLAPADVLVRERVGRYWIVSPMPEQPVARELGEQLAASVSDSASIAGAPLTASVGLAMFPADGKSPDELAEKADERLFAARSAGIRIA
jgi:GGDEF domain-containing protein